MVALRYAVVALLCGTAAAAPAATITNWNLTNVDQVPDAVRTITAAPS